MVQQVHPNDGEETMPDNSPSVSVGKIKSGVTQVTERFYHLTSSRPCAVLWAVMLSALLLTALPFILFQGDAVEIDMSLESFEIKGDAVADRSRSFRAARCGGRCNSMDERRLQVSDTTGSGWAAPLNVVYVAKDDGNILTESNLAQALELERQVVGLLGGAEPLHSTLKDNIFPNYPESTGLPTGTGLASHLESIAETRYDRGSAWSYAKFDKNFNTCNLRSALLSSRFEPESQDAYEEIAALETDNVNVAFFEDYEDYFDDQRNDQIAKDTMLLIGVLVAVGLVLTLATGSPFIMSLGLLSIIMATGVALFLYRALFSKWFGILNAFAFFLLLGIGCDDIFVLVDTWRQSTEIRSIPADDYVARLRYTLPRAGKAIMTTSLTTAVAFFGNAISVVPPLRLFGLFSGLMVLADFFLTMTFLPSVLVLQHRLFKDVTCGGFNQGPVSGESRKGDKLLMWMAPKIIRAAPFLVVLSAIVGGLSLNIALELPSGVEFHPSELFPDSHNQNRARRARVLQGASGGSSSDFTPVFFVYGVEPQDTGSSLDPSDTSEAAWDTGFDIFDPAVQQFTLDFCSALVGNRGLVRQLRICWAQSLQELANSNGRPFPTSNREDVLNAINYHFVPGLVAHDGGYWANIEVAATVLEEAATPELRKFHDQFEVFMQEWNQEALRRGVTGASRGFHTSGRWIHMATIESLATSSIGAMSISTAFAAGMLLVSFRNFVMVGLLMLHIVGVALALVTILVLEGRKLGVMESISLSLLVGLAVDYLAHLGTAYLEEDTFKKSRTQLVVSAIAHLGGSVVAGATTTIIAAVFLLFGTITFFSTFGAFILEIICLALLATMLSFVSALALFGPEQGFGTVSCPPGRSSGTTAEGESHPDALVDSVQVPTHSKKIRWATAGMALLVLLVSGGVRLGLSLSKDEEETVVCPDLEYLDYTFENFAIPSERDSYRCRGFSLVPSGCTYYVTEMRPLINPPSLNGTVHHMLLYTVSKTVSDCPFTCFDMPHTTGLDFAWAIGGGPVIWPAGSALAMGGQPQALQMHYENAAVASNLVDSGSGMRLMLTKTPPERLLVTLNVGLHPEGDLSIAPGLANSTWAVECVPVLRGNITVIAYTTHAHKVGRSVVTQVLRDGQPAGDVGSTPSFNFNFQRVSMFAPGEERVLRPGDSIRVLCTYNTQGRTEVTRNGWQSEEEMCMTFLVAHPSSNVASHNCLTMSAQSV